MDKKEFDNVDSDNIGDVSDDFLEIDISADNIPENELEERVNLIQNNIIRRKEK